MPRSTVTQSSSPAPYAGLTPELVLAASEFVGLQPDGRLFALNSYENRVYQLGLESGERVVMKFYRADRWSDQQILEEHAWALDLAAADIGVVAPLIHETGTLHHFKDFRFALFPWRGGPAPDLDQPGARELLGRTLGRIHAIGAGRRFIARPALEGERLGHRARQVVLRSPQLPPTLRDRYAAISGLLLSRLEELWQPLRPVETRRLHGDCHLGNILWQPTGPLFVDLDDCLQGVAVQDLWMFLAGDGDEQRGQWQELLAGYQQFCEFDHAEVRLIEPLRATRMLNHAAWIAERWLDPAFPRAFPWFGDARFWEQHINDLAEQCAVLDEPPAIWG